MNSIHLNSHIHAKQQSKVAGKMVPTFSSTGSTDSFYNSQKKKTLVKSILSFGSSFSNDPLIKDFYQQVAKIEAIQSIISLINWKETIKPDSVKNSYDVKQDLLVKKNAIIKSDHFGETLLELSESDAQSKMDREDLYLFEKWSEVVFPEQKAPTSIKLTKAMVPIINNARKTWAQAKENNDFEAFKETLKTVFQYHISTIEENKNQKSIYNGLLQKHDSDMNIKEMDKTFETLKASIVPLVKEIQAKQAKENEDYPFLNMPVKADKILPLINQMLTDIGFDFKKGELGKTDHPITTQICPPTDVRISIRKTPDTITLKEVIELITDAVHECGHALIYQNASDHLKKTGLIAPTKSVSEAQARLWEIMVSKSKPFWTNYYNKLQDIYPEALKEVSLDDFYKGINKVNISPVRLLADELTYNLHILMRYEIEKEMINNRENLCEVIDQLPETWNTKSEEYLGIKPKNDSEGVLQDTHWAYGLIGYFPSYTVGNIIAAQLFEAIKKDIPQLETQISQGNFKPMLNWLTQNINKDGGRESYNTVLKRVTGEKLQPRHFTNYLKTKYSDIYDL